MYVYQHYPLALYRNGEYMAVADEAEEAAARREGWTDYLTDREGPKTPPEPVSVDPEPIPEPVSEPVSQPPAKRGPGRPRKA